jgi:RNA recognition motif-containing protein
MTRVHIGNLSSTITDAKLNDLAKPFGTVQSANVVVDRMNGTSKGFAFVEFESNEAAAAAIAGLNGKEIEGKVVRVSEAKPKKA